MEQPLHLDALIFGGGITGLWLLDALHRSGHRALLLEAGNLGEGQTINAQGIIHGGLKYALKGHPSRASRMIRDMPMRWRRCLAGEEAPDLSSSTMRGEYCCLWSLPGLRSRIGLLGARFGLRVRPRPLPQTERPEPLRNWNGPVSRIDEQVIEPHSVLAMLADQHRPRCLQIDTHSGLEFPTAAPGQIETVRLLNPETSEPLDLAPQRIIFAAGSGNAQLRRSCGLSGGAMQLRPLHMVMARGGLPRLNGHCIKGTAPWLTITSTLDCADRVVWQIGGQLAEDCVDMPAEQTIARARADLLRAMPDLDLSNTRFTTYRADRAEASNEARRPDGPVHMLEGNTLTLWPTKLALVPMLTDQVMEGMPAPTGIDYNDEHLQDWPRPTVALPPWERDVAWTDMHSAAQGSM